MAGDNPADDTYKTIDGRAEAVFTEKRSKFISIAVPVTSVDEVRAHLDECGKAYYDARHICYAYILGSDRKVFRANDNGEPSGTAGRPILGQINSMELTDVLVMVIRYFGGIKLGTGGLIVAYRQAASLALEAATIVEKTVDEAVSIVFEYPFLNDVMRVVKDDGPTIVDQAFDMDCRMTLSIRRSRMGQMRNKLSKVETLYFTDEK